MSAPSSKPAAPGFVVLQQTAEGPWRLLGEVRRKPGETYAAVLRSEWLVAQKWGPTGKR